MLRDIILLMCLIFIYFWSPFTYLNSEETNGLSFKRNNKCTDRKQSQYLMLWGLFGQAAWCYGSWGQIIRKRVPGWTAVLHQWPGINLSSPWDSYSTYKMTTVKSSLGVLCNRICFPILSTPTWTNALTFLGVGFLIDKMGLIMIITAWNCWEN